MTDDSPLKGTALIIGAVGVLLMVVGLVIVLLDDPDQGSALGGVLVRVGALLGAIALVLPTIRRPSFPTLAIAGAGLILVLARPGLVWAALIGWSIWAVLGRQRRTSNRES